MLDKYIFTFLVLFTATLAASERIAVDATVTNTLARYAWFASAAYSSYCEIPPFNTTVEKEFYDVVTDTQATLFRDDLTEEYILAFRGTSSILDIITDLRMDLVDCTPALPSCPRCTCHQGFLYQYLAVRDEITLYLTTKLQDTGYNLTVTGHSMGAAGASLFATALRAQTGLAVTAYTYGQPRTGNAAYANFVDALFPPSLNKMVRVTHANDGVAQVPPRERRYCHHSTEMWIPPASAGEVYRCEGQEPRDCNARVWGYPLNSPHYSYFGVGTGNLLYPDAACLGGWTARLW